MWKRTLAFIICTSICVYSTWKQLQLIAVVSLFFILAVIFKNRAMQLFDILTELLKNTGQAKLGTFEFQIQKQIENVSNEIVTKSAWVQILLNQLSSDEVGLLLSLKKEKKLTATEAIKNKLRSLRNRGLVLHDSTTIADSETVWLSKIGQEFVDILFEVEGIKNDSSN